MCDVRKCVFACLWRTIFSQIETGEDVQELNRCTYCDERRCGINFVQCAGANRRRTGIISDIERDLDQEVCEKVDTQWWRNESIQTVWAQGEANKTQME